MPFARRVVVVSGPATVDLVVGQPEKRFRRNDQQSQWPQSADLTSRGDRGRRGTMSTATPRRVAGLFPSIDPSRDA